ncbi:hypothetical protein Q31b_43690 [Novipirellula aureliae]|uniref:Uncharacterized protein n=1 Tax=Novipirellula aureliae TaxID=2527966 RepID=A0A5C6DPL4_9BACT|nr:hypothetical protein Q31b_43690 [Novipirellula aureliae]
MNPVALSAVDGDLVQDPFSEDLEQDPRRVEDHPIGLRRSRQQAGADSVAMFLKIA